MQSSEDCAETPREDDEPFCIICGGPLASRSCKEWCQNCGVVSNCSDGGAL